MAHNNIGVNETYRSGQPQPTRMTSAWFGVGVADSTIVVDDDFVFYVPNEYFEQIKVRKVPSSWACVLSCRTFEKATAESKIFYSLSVFTFILAFLPLTTDRHSHASDTPWTAPFRLRSVPT